MNGTIDNLYRDDRRSGGLLGAILLSLALHSVLVLVWLTRQPAIAPAAQSQPLRYVELQAPSSRPDIEAPGPAVEMPPRPDAALSDANRRATAPESTGTQPTSRPGDGRMYNPEGGAAASPRPAQSPAAQPRASEMPRSADGSPAAAPQTSAAPAGRSTVAEPTPTVNWNSALKDLGRAGAAPGSVAAPASVGGDEGFAESGPVSFESQWYDWGQYGTLMVAKIRYHWYRNMPDIVKLGMKGVVTIRFTIQRSGQITDIEMLKSSGTPPLDFAGRKAIELASPLQPLPGDFPDKTERVTVSFYYNLKPPQR